MADDNGPRDPKIIPFRPRGSGPNGPIQGPGTQAPELELDTYRIVVYNRQNEEVEYIKTGHLIVTNINIALLDEKSELIWAIPNSNDLVFVERLDDLEVEVDLDEDLPSED